MWELCFILSLFSTAFAIVTNIAGAGVANFCPADATNCMFKWTIALRQSMMYYRGHNAYPVVWRNGGFHYRTFCGEDVWMYPINNTVLEGVHTVDGGYQYIKTINNQFPGPSIVVYEGQEIEIEVTNNLIAESTGIHWHGMHQLNSNWMDGVPGTTQCPINPDETFTYRFIASPAGTHWYHSHQAAQRVEGLYGAIIVLPHPNKIIPAPGFTLPSFNKEFIMMVSENKPHAASEYLYSTNVGLRTFLYGEWNNTGACFGLGGPSADTNIASVYQFHSGLINGKGQKFDENGTTEVNVPLETFTVQQNQYYRFRVINTASHYTFKISVDEHPLVMIASDGMDINPIVADSFHVNSGERFDFYIYTNNTVQNYYIRVETIEIEPHYTLAILIYEGSNATVKPTTNDTCKSPDVNCTILNCPFKSFRRGLYVGSTCINFESITSPYDYVEDTGSKFLEYFIPFGRGGPYGRRAHTANGMMFMRPSTPPVVTGTAMYEKDCRHMPECANTSCHCTNQIDLPLGHTIQVTIFANDTHPIHLHGHSFRVVKVGYASEEHDQWFRSITKYEKDILCHNYMCSNASWRNSSWANGNIPGMNIENPPLKDTITIPGGGYVVLRFKTNNPGWWMFHCHVDTHFLDGMGLMFQIGTDDEMRVPPAGFKTCGSYKFNHSEFMYAMTHTVYDIKNGNGGEIENTTNSNGDEIENTTNGNGGEIENTTNSNGDEIENAESHERWLIRVLAYGYIAVSVVSIIIGIVIGCCCGSCRNSKVDKM